ncbi:outer membrane beta-barrel protein, partial [Acidithiobacillus caldus]
VEIGKLPTLIGAEDGFTFQNLNIERGLLWDVEPIVSRGVQANYSMGPLSASLSWNDGYYSNRYNTVSGDLTWTIDGSNSLE